MTEAEWFSCEDPGRILDFLKGRVSGRKLQLFACGCCRALVWHLLPGGRGRRVVELAERYADGGIDRNKMVVAYHDAWRAAEAAWDAAVDSNDLSEAAAANARVAAAWSVIDCATARLTAPDPV